MGKKKNKKSSGNGSNEQWAVIKVGSFRLSFPQPRLPLLLGADNLSAQNTIYPARVPLCVPGIVGTFSVAAGALAASQPIDTTLIQSFSTRFATLFREYCIVGATIELRQNVGANPTGIAKFWVDEDSNATPTAAQANSRATIDIPILSTPVGKVYKIMWKPLDYLDLDWEDVGTNTQPAFLKAFTSTATGVSVTTTASFSYNVILSVDFRGYI